MKKIFLMASAMMAFSAFAQDGGDEPKTYSPGFVIEVAKVNPGDDPEVIEMVPTDHTKSEAQTPVYNAKVTIPVFEDTHTKYQYTVYYTPQDGGETVKAGFSQIERGFEDGELTVMVAAWIQKDGTAFVSFSNTPYVICDSNWTAMGYFEGSSTGDPQTTYLNDSEKKDYATIRNIDLGKSTNDYIAGGNNQYQAYFVEGETPGKKKNGLWKAVFDYSKASITFEEVHSFTVEIAKYRTFVAPAQAILPVGLTAYHFAGYSDGVMTMDPIEGKIIPANVPVILTADTEGEYTIRLTGEHDFQFSDDGKRAWMASTAEPGSIYYGVHQPNYVPLPGYLFDGEKFVKVSSRTIVDTFRCDIRLTEEEATDVEEITVVYNEPKEDVLYIHYTTQTGDYDSTHDQKLTKNNDNEYVLESLQITGSDLTHFVLSKYNFSEESDLTRSNATWTGFNGTIYHVTDDGLEEIDPESAEEIKPMSYSAGNYMLRVATDDNGKPASVDMTPNVGTGIESITSDESYKENAEMFNVLGQKVNENYKGIVIRNGKKLILR